MRSSLRGRRSEVKDARKNGSARERERLPKRLRDGPLEKLWGGGGGGEFSSRRNFFSLSNSLYEFFLGHSMNIF